MMLAVSAILLLFVGLLAAFRFGESGAARFWIWLALVVFQIGGIAVGLSCANQLAPVPWMFLHGFIALGAAWFSRDALPKFKDWVTDSIRPAPRRLLEFFWSLSGIEGVFTFLLGLIGVFAFVQQWVTPIYEGDEKMYHASRVLYWITNGNIFPFETHNDRQTVFQFGSELFFLWPVLLSKSERVARTIFWMGFPMAIVGQWLLLRALKVSRTVALGAILLVMTTPIVSSYWAMIKPEMWSIVFFSGLLWWAIRLMAGGAFSTLWLGVYFVLCLNIRATGVVLIAPLALLMLVSAKAGIKQFLAGVMIAFVLSAAFVPLTWNWIKSGHPLGPEKLRAFHASERTLQQFAAHTARFALQLVELPEVPSAVALEPWNQAFRKVAEVSGANRMLIGERTDFWPGYFQYEQKLYARQFSLGGICWLFTFLFVMKAGQRKDLAAVWLLMATLTAAIVLGIRWMPHSGLPDRFLITPYAGGIAVAAAMAGQLLMRNKAAQSVALLLMAWAVYPSLRQSLLATGNRVLNPPLISTIDAPFEEAMRLIPPGSRILVFGNHQAPDYPLFAPRQGYANQVFPWGKEQIEPGRLHRVIAENQITHLVFQDARALPFEWAPVLWVDRALPWMLQDKDLRLILASGEIRVFATPRAKVMQLRATSEQLTVTGAPRHAPLLFVSPDLKDHVSVDENELTTPWAIENVNGSGYFWIGSGERFGINFGVWTDQTRTVRITMELEPGPGRKDLLRTVVVDSPTATRQFCREQFDRKQLVVCQVELQAPHGALRIWSPDQPTIAVQPNGDPRALMEGLYRIRIEGR